MADIEEILVEKITAKRLPEKPPTPLPRDKHGNQRPKRYVAIKPQPSQEDGLYKNYDSVIRILEKHLPLHAARLRDLMDRVEEAREQLHLLKEEELALFEKAKAEAIEHNRKIDEEIKSLNGEYAAKIENLDAEIRMWQEELKQARIELEVAKADAGLPIDLKWTRNTEQLELEDEDTATAIELEADSKPRNGGLFGRLGNYLGSTFKRRSSSKNVSSPTEDENNGSVDTYQQYQSRTLDASSSREMQAQRPSVLTMDEALSRVPDVHALAAKENIPDIAAIDHPRKNLDHALTWFSLVAVGCIFGLSMAFITGILTSIETLSSKWPLATACSILGIAMFWTMGQVVWRASYLASEGLHTPKVSTPQLLEVWTTKAAKWILGLLIFIAILLIFMEASVEKEGVIGQLWQKRILTEMFRSGDLKKRDVPEWSVWMVVLCISLPFILFRIGEAWATARRKVVDAYLNSKRSLAAYELIRKSYEDRDKWLAERPIEQSTTVADEPNEVFDEEPEESDSDIDIRRRLAAAKQRVLYAYQRLRETRAQKRDARDELKTKIDLLEIRRKPEITEMSLESKRRLEDAYFDLIGAVRTFDKEYAKLSKALERLPKVSIIVQMINFVIGSRHSSAITNRESVQL